MKTPDDLLDSLLSAILNRELTTTLDCFTSDAVVLGSEKGEETHGIDDLRAFFERIYSKDGKYQFRFEDRSWVVRDDVAWMISNGSITEPGHLEAKNYRLVAIFEKQETNWCIALWSGTEPI